MTSFPRKTPVGMTRAQVDNLESTYGVTFKDNTGDNPSDSGGGRNITLTVPNGFYAKISCYGNPAVIGQNNSLISLSNGEQKFLSDIILTAGQKISGTFTYLLFEV